MTNETEYQRGYREGAEKMREDAEKSLSKRVDSWSKQSDMALAGQAKQQLAGRAVEAQECVWDIRKLPITPPQPAAQDDEREMRKAFEKWWRKEKASYTYYSPHMTIALEAWQAALASRAVLSEGEAVSLMAAAIFEEEYGLTTSWSRQPSSVHDQYEDLARAAYRTLKAKGGYDG